MQPLLEQSRLMHIISSMCIPSIHKFLSLHIDIIVRCFLVIYKKFDIHTCANIKSTDMNVFREVRFRFSDLAEPELQFGSAFGKKVKSSHQTELQQH